MKDKQLLEFCAKAVGIDLTFGRTNTYIGLVSSGIIWNPIEDDGDSLRVAKYLGFMVGFKNGSAIVYGEMPMRDFIENKCHRRAIVIAAAEIGSGLRIECE